MLILIGVIAVVVLIAGGLLLWRGGNRLQGLGSSMLTSAIFTLGFFLVQQHIQNEREKQAKREQFALTVGFSRNLEALDPRYPLAGMHLAGKVLDRAKLRDADLSGANLQDASLRKADLRGADLEGANLFGADLTEANLSGVTLKNADLRFADFRDVTIYGEKGADLDVAGARVNARTCWPDDFLSSLLLRRLHRGLKPEPVKVRGQELAGADIGHVCVLRFDSVVDDVGQYQRGGRTVAQVARTFRVKPARVVRALRGRLNRSAFGSNRPTVDTPCAGDRQIDVSLGVWEKGRSLLVVEDQAREMSSAKLVEVKSKTALKGRRPPRLELPAGGNVVLVGSTGDWAEYRLERRVRRC